MDLHTLNVFLTVARERSFSVAAEQLFRTQPAVSLAVQRLESAVDEKLLDRSGRQLVLTDAGELVLEYALRFENLSRELEHALAELRDKTAGKLAIGANESTTLYLLKHIHQFRGLYPKVKVEIRRSLSSRLPAAIIRGDLELGAISYEPNDERLSSSVIYVDRLCFVVSPGHRLAKREKASIRELGGGGLAAAMDDARLLQHLGVPRSAFPRPGTYLHAAPNRRHDGRTRSRIFGFRVAPAPGQAGLSGPVPRGSGGAFAGALACLRDRASGDLCWNV